MGVNRETLSKVINKYSGMNFRKFINRHRVEYALTLMSESENLTFFDVCVSSGFNSINAFNAAFKYFLGQKPSDVRNDFMSRRKAKKPIVIPAWDSYAFV